MIFHETGQLMSDATRRAYMETGNLDEALSISDTTHNQWLEIWGDENTFVQAHGEFGSDLKSAFGIDRTMMSVTTDPEVAEYFAKFNNQNGVIFEGYVPNSQLLPQTLPGAGESEYLIKYTAKGFTIK